ncbi:MAG: hypothetical protein JWP31_1668 [Aeromicrobium sp.]|nr:hypothetical protein [Aeromicrobium sp.]
MAGMRITLISGADGVPFVHELATALSADDELTVIAPTVRDHWSAWLKACPDLDALLTQPGTPTTHAVADQLKAIDYSPAWQRTSDQDVATRLVRTELIGTGFALTDATMAAATRAKLPYRLVPMSDDRAELHVVVGGDEPRAIHIAQYLAEPSAHEPTETLLVAETWAVSPAAAAAVQSADVVVLGPSSRTLAIDPVLRTPGLLDALPCTTPVLVVEHDDTAPADLIRVAGVRQDDPGLPERVPSDVRAVLELAGRVTA